MEIPVYIDGRAAGALRWRREGLYTVFESLLPPREGLTRLWVAGGGKSACLGLLEPTAEGLRLRRRLSALEMRALPESLEYALLHEPEPAPVEETPAPEEEAPAPEEEAPAPETEAPAPEEEAPDQETEAPDPEGLLWFARPDGSLTAFDGRSVLLALPAQLRRREPGARLARIGGREYMVFRT